jgi:PPOX class probable F420-dependent enzyme
MFTDEQLEYVREHVWAVLATGRADGSPQIGMIGYHFDGARFVISTKAFTARWKNALRNPSVAMVIHDGRQQLVVYGTAECIDADPERAELSADVFQVIMGASERPDPAGLIPTLDDQQRTVLRITPTKVSYNP